MKNIVALSLFCFVSSLTTCFSQPCVAFSLGEFFDELKALKTTSVKLHFEKHSNFDFTSFKPIDEEVVDSLRYVDVGYDSKNNVRELVFRRFNEIYALSVYDFRDHRVLILKRRDGDGSDEWLFTSTAILASKTGNYMINVVPLFEGDYNPYKLYKYFPVTTFDKVSCLMNLREDLYPREFVRFSNGKIVMHSGLKYEFERSRKLELEVIHFFIDPEHYFPNLGVEKNSCMKEIMDKMIVLTTKSNLIVSATPSVFKDTDAPLWIFGGGHSYFFYTR